MIPWATQTGAVWEVQVMTNFRRLRTGGESKYKNRKKFVDGIEFDSVKEARRWSELKLLEKAGEISDLRRQVKFVLIESQYEESSEVYQRGKNKGKPKRGKILEHECSYIADFVYTDEKTGKTVVEDTKGFKTKDYIIKRKLLLERYKIRITEV